MKTHPTRRTTRALARKLAAPPAGKHFLRLYVAGATARSREALQRVHQLCAAEMKDNFVLEVIDVYQQPGLARDHQIIATPTLIREFPRPVRRFIGSLSNLTRLWDESDGATPRKLSL